MDTPDFEHGRVYFKQFGAERVKSICELKHNTLEKLILNDMDSNGVPPGFHSLNYIKLLFSMYLSCYILTYTSILTETFCSNYQLFIQHVRYMYLSSSGKVKLVSSI